MKKYLDKPEMNALSEILNIDVSVLHILAEHRLLDIKQGRNLLIKKEFRKQTGGCKKQKGKTIAALAEKYNISASAIEQVIYNKNTARPFYCIKCNGIIPKYKYNKNEGNCDNCK